MTGYRRPTIRYERHADNYCGFPTLTGALNCFRRLAKLAT
ncbi:hypothetical protein APASM_3841 [Actinosynnema pretiosum subsp. pretiosum]|nr:hypothetical protein APASM_3841 [Actinosynnema pretiosum subsp. pretiosum]